MYKIAVVFDELAYHLNGNLGVALWWLNFHFRLQLSVLLVTQVLLSHANASNHWVTVGELGLHLVFKLIERKVEPL